ncbi:MAG: metal ABC transporter ATP-binding protein [Tannerella sp.]|jgi:zinc transport system ATP-binding protein|nr:metal ABC transporter ATP-binding protein [Tannerella sp.]
MNKLIEMEHISASYEAKTVLRDISLTLWENDFLGIIGPNGGGKTTLLKVVLGLLKPSVGRVLFYENGHPAPSLKIGYLPQINQIDKRFPISVQEVIASGLMAEKKPLRGYSDEQIRRMDEVIGRLGLEKLVKRPVGELSGGEWQRVLLGRSIVSRPKVLVLDEPNTYVDKSFEARLYALLGEMNRDTAVMLVSHDIAAIRPLVKNIAYVNKTLRYE